MACFCGAEAQAISALTQRDPVWAPGHGARCMIRTEPTDIRVSGIYQ